MPDDFLKAIKDFLSEIPVPLLAGISSGILVLFRIAYAREEKNYTRRFLESTICTMLTISSSYLFIALGFDEVVSYAIGGYVGWFGADEAARIAKNKVKALTKSEEDDKS